MDKIKRITANLPESLIKEATAVTGATLTETLIQGLLLVKRGGAYKKAQRLKGKLAIELDLDVSRERSGR
jgi:hypothetical protein